jgi:hypothetical protein
LGFPGFAGAISVEADFSFNASTMSNVLVDAEFGQGWGALPRIKLLAMPR